MKTTNIFKWLTISVAVLAATLMVSNRAQAHCDSLDGPVVKAAQRALAEGNINHVLIWVQKDDELEIKHAFKKTLAVRKLNADAQELADTYFFETLVRIHRAGEGAPYTGLKPAGRDLGPAIPAADQALNTRKIQPVIKLLTTAMHDNVERHFQDALKKKNFAPDNVEAGREFARAYVEFIHCVEALYQQASSQVHSHSEAAEGWHYREERKK